MNTKYTYIAFLLAAAALIAWGAVLFFAWSIDNAEGQYVEGITNAQQSSVAQSSSVRTHAVAAASASDRAQLDQLLAVDIVAIANMLQGVGVTSGVNVKLSGALPESAPAAVPGAAQVQAVGFAVQADGTFEALMRTVQRIETLPIASTIERFDIQRGQSATGASTGLWHMSVYIRVLTTAVSS